MIMMTITTSLLCSDWIFHRLNLYWVLWDELWTFLHVVCDICVTEVIGESQVTVHSCAE